jgi:hypothetical protein
MIKNVVVIMVRSTSQDILLLNECLASLEQNFMPTVNDADFVFFVESDFGDLKDQIRLPSNFENEYKFVEIDLALPESISEKFQIPKYFPHPTHSNGPIDFGHPGFSIKYRSMCRFFSGAFYKHESLTKYTNYIRLDTDSKFVQGKDFSLFRWLESNSYYYGFIESAIQEDDKNVVKNLRETLKKYIGWPKKIVMPQFIGSRMYYTNFEIGSLDYFRSNTWQDFFNFLDNSGGFYLFRWGDAPVRFAGLWAICSKKRISKIPAGFTYFHGDYYES